MKLSTLFKRSLIIVMVIGLVACSSTEEPEAVAPVTPSPSPLASAQVTPAGDNTFGFLPDTMLTSDQLLAIRTYYFKLNSTDLLGLNLQAVQAQGNYLAINSNQRVLLKGYTDIQGSREYNIGLGYRRVQVVSKELMAKGVNKNQIEMVSYGPEFPADSGNTQQAYQKNRRVEVAYCEGAFCASVYRGGALKGNVKK